MLGFITAAKVTLTSIFIKTLAEVPGAARVNLQPAEHLKICPSAFKVSSRRGQGGEGAGVKPRPKPSLDRWGCVCKIRSAQGFGIQ